MSSTLLRPPASQQAPNNDPKFFDPNSDITIRMLRQQLRKGGVKAMPVFIGQARAKSSEHGTDSQLAAHLRYEAASAARALGKLDEAEEFVIRAVASLPPMSLDLLYALKRLHARIKLDQGKGREAESLAGEADGLVFERVRGAAPMILRDEGQVGYDTWAVLAEIAMAEDRMEEARAALDKAQRRLARDAEVRRGRLDGPDAALAAFDPQMAQAERDEEEAISYLRFLEILWHLHAGEEGGRDMLSLFSDRLGRVQSPDARMLARVAAVSGEWKDSMPVPPSGINLPEARRLFELAHSVAPPRPTDDASVDDEHPEQSAGANESSGGISKEGRLAAEIIAAVFERVGQPAALHKERPDSAFGGKFAHYDIISQLNTAEEKKFTGYIQATWDAATIAAMIEQGRIHKAAAAGKGWIFLRDGLICDATLGTANVPQRGGELHANAKDAVMVMAQVGLGLTPTDKTAEGHAYADDVVRQRKTRLEVMDNDMYVVSLISEDETEQEERRRGEHSAEAGATREMPATTVEGERACAAEPQATEAPETAAISTRPARGDEALLFLPIMTAMSVEKLAGALCGSVESFSPGPVYVKVFSGEKDLAEAHTMPWGRVERAAARAQLREIQLAKGLRIEVGSSTALPPEVSRALLEAAALRLRVMPLAVIASNCLKNYAAEGVVVESLKMRAVYDLVFDYARRNEPVLISGETGTGKELIARRIHELSDRAAGPWVAENLAAMPDDLFRSTLFGHVRGAFTGAEKDRNGLFTLAAGGTAFVDEYGELDMVRQGMVLRVLEEREYSPVGSDKKAKLSARVIFATNRVIDDDAIFRQDIKYRCKVIRVPALREHPEDIRPMAVAFAKENEREITEAAIAWCEGHRWPGNIRELKEVVTTAAILAARREDEITVEDVVSAVGQYESEMPWRDGGGMLVRPNETRAAALERLEKEFVTQALDLAGRGRGQQKRAAEIYGVKRQTFANLLARHGLVAND